MQVLSALPSADEFGGRHLSSLDCTDRSVNLWDTLRPLVSPPCHGLHAAVCMQLAWHKLEPQTHAALAAS